MSTEKSIFVVYNNTPLSVIDNSEKYYKCISSVHSDALLPKDKCEIIELIPEHHETLTELYKRWFKVKDNNKLVVSKDTGLIYLVKGSTFELDGSERYCILERPFPFIQLKSLSTKKCEDITFVRGNGESLLEMSNRFYNYKEFNTKRIRAILVIRQLLHSDISNSESMHAKKVMEDMKEWANPYEIDSKIKGKNIPCEMDQISTVFDLILSGKGLFLEIAMILKLVDNDESSELRRLWLPIHFYMSASQSELEPAFNKGWNRIPTILSIKEGKIINIEIEGTELTSSIEEPKDAAREIVYKYGVARKSQDEYYDSFDEMRIKFGDLRIEFKNQMVPIKVGFLDGNLVSTEIVKDDTPTNE